MEESKKSNPLLRFFSTVLSVILFIVLVIVAAGAFSFLDRKSSLAAIPKNYSAYIRASSAFDALNPLLDLKAADVLLSSPEYSKFRQIFMKIRSSDLRTNRFFKFLASRPVDFAVYDSGNAQDFVAVVDLGPFSALTRPSKIYVEKLGIPNLSFFQDEETYYYAYKTNESVFYAKPVKNLLVAGTSLELLLRASLDKNDAGYSSEDKKMISEKTGSGFRIIADARRLFDSLAIGNDTVKNMVNLISPDALSVISFTVSDSDINVKCQLPLDGNSQSSLSKILEKNSTAPAILSRLIEPVQYYTILNAGTLEELKDAVFPFVPKEKNIEKNWRIADSVCSASLQMGLSELLFSWSGSNFAAFGIENQNDPVFAIQIASEKQRKAVFEKIASSVFIKDDNNLILGGARLSQMQLPQFLNKLLLSFDISIPEPYYFVKDGYIYFSQSPECLSEIYTSSKENRLLVKSNGWKLVSSGQKSDSIASIFYNLEKNIPFFLRSNKGISNVLRLYNMGRADVRIRKDKLEIQIQSCAEKSQVLRSVPGFPVGLGGKVEPENFQLSPMGDALFWLENEKYLKALDLSGLTISEKNLNDRNDITTAAEVSVSGGALWTVSSYGVVSLLDNRLESVSGFPVVLESAPSARPAAVGSSLVVPLEEENIAFVSDIGNVTYITLDELSVKSAPAVLDEIVAVYDKGFLGKIYYFENEKCLNENEPVLVNEIGLGSPALLKKGNKTYTGFVSQSGTVDLWSDGVEVKNFPVKIPGVFLQNLAASSKYFYALSSDAVLYRISLDGAVLSVKIPNSTAKNAYLSAVEYEKNGECGVFVCADANVIYGFNEELELLSGFPLPGWGNPAFADSNGDKVPEIFALSMDKKIVSWSLVK